ncbi:MAG TPA: ATP-binding cassette domain-containing protein [Solirubrobacteraceae bacterium]|nr:ATP-binding cassette domain-containing protein [Solirubrobacteraceae bacterium]
MLEVLDLRHRFGELLALDGVSLTVGDGELVGLVGRNGAGKTTAMRAIMGILAPDAGEVRWQGGPVGEGERLRFGYMPEERGLYAQMRIGEQVAYFARLHGLERQAAARAAEHWLTRLGLGARAQDQLVALSHGNQQRVQLAVALAHDPLLLVLDEPFGGLDPEAVDSLSEVLREQGAGGRSILFSSHQLELVERICRRVVVLDAGRVIAAGTLAELRERLPAQLRVRVGGSTDWASGLAGVKVLGGDEEGVLLRVDPGVDSQAILRAAQAAGPVERFAFESAGLIDLYRRMISRGTAPGPRG